MNEIKKVMTTLVATIHPAGQYLSKENWWSCNHS